MYMYTTVQMLALHYQEPCSNSVYEVKLKTTVFALTTAMKALHQVASFPGLPPSPPKERPGTHCLHMRVISAMYNNKCDKV